MTPPVETAEKWAVLIGVDYYINGTARSGIIFHNLRGCVEDITRVKEYLQDSEGIPESNIFQLTATTPDNDTPGPKEMESEWPTYENIILAIENVTEKAKANDVVYIHYSGHGIRTATIFDDLKGEHAHDEGLVPTNIHCEKGRYVRDVEIAYLLQRMVKKDLIVTVVLDCCHSGGANRGNHGGDPTRYRGIDMIDENKLPDDKSDIPDNKLHEVMENPSPAEDGSRKATVEDHWRLRPSGYTFLAACQQHQLAMEDEFGGQTQGLLTYYLLEVLRETHIPMNHYQLWKLVAIKVAERSEQLAKRTKQHVVLGGESNRMFLSSQCSEIFNTATVIEVSKVPQGSTTAMINAGQAHGVEVQMKLDVWPSSCTTLYQSERLGYLTVTSVTGLGAKTEFIQTLEQGQPLQVGCLMLPCSTASGKRVRIIQQQISSDSGVTDNSLRSLQTAWAEVGTSFASLIDREEDEEDFQIRIENGDYLISGKGGEKLQHHVPELPINGDNVPRQLVHQLTHLAKYHSLLDLKDRRNSASGLPRISVSGSPEPYPHPEEDVAPRKADCPRPERHPYPDSRPAEEKLFILRVENKSEFVVYITVLDLDSTWGIEQMHPEDNDTCDSLDPGQSVYIPMKIEKLSADPNNSNASDVLDIFLVFATREPTTFGWLELPKLDKVDGSGRRGTRGQSQVDDVNAIFGMTSHNPLQAMQVAWTLHDPAFRKAQRLTPPNWTVERLVLTEADVHP
ncbi:hypothetical protein G7054_g6562 [Neopestalotiopsis clavispora]|nr:hypothetical protein G7054_g6562 [Neopestalotiopsis clavispora]